MKPAADALGSVITTTTQGAGVTAAAGTRLARLLFLLRFRPEKSLRIAQALGVPSSGVSPLRSFRNCCAPWGLDSCLRVHLRATTPIARTRRRLVGPLHPLLPDRPQTHPWAPELWAWAPSSSLSLWGIILSFPRVSPSQGQVVRVLLSRAPRAEPSRLACLKRTPIAVAAGRINRS